MLPSINEALKELRIAGELNPGPWIKQSENVGIAARNIAEKIPYLNSEKAYIVGILHDIGRRIGIVKVMIMTCLSNYVTALLLTMAFVFLKSVLLM